MPTVTPPRTLERTAEIVLERSVPSDDCLIFTGDRKRDNPRIWNGTGIDYAYRIVWMVANGPIPEGHHIDHMCFTPRCVNIEHLRPLPAEVNCALHALPHYHLRKTQCPRGHPYPEPVAGGKRNCRQCRADRRDDYNARRRARRAAGKES